MNALKNFLFLKIITVSEAGYWILASTWGVLVLLGAWSVCSKPMGMASRIFWLAAIIFLPIIGLFAYVVSCLIYADWEVLKQMGFFSLSKKKIASSIRPVEH